MKLEKINIKLFNASKILITHLFIKIISKNINELTSVILKLNISEYEIRLYLIIFIISALYLFRINLNARFAYFAGIISAIF